MKVTASPTPAPKEAETTADKNKTENKADEVGALPPDLQEEGKGQARIGVTQYVSYYYIFIFKKERIGRKNNITMI